MSISNTLSECLVATIVFLLVNNVNAQTIDNQLLIVPNGLISQKPIISDATFAIIAKKNNLLSNDIAVKMGKMKKIEPTNTEDLYFSTLDVDTNINYVAASVVASITNYKKYAQFDISNNIGVIATLYNLGDEKKRE